MDLWDEDRQEWGRAAHPERSPRPSRARRTLIAALAALLLCGAVATGVWLWVDDGSGGVDDLPEVGGGSGRSGATPSASAACEVVDTAIVDEWGLDGGREENVESAGASLFSGCTWSMSEDGTTPVAQLSVYYGEEIPIEPSPTPTTVDGVPSAQVSGNETACLVRWPTSFGMAVVQAVPTHQDSSRSACDLASAFAGAVAANVTE